MSPNATSHNITQGKSGMKHYAGWAVLSIAELFPTEMRGTAQTALYNAGRFIGGASAPVYIPIIAAAHGFGFAIGCVAFIYMIAFIAMFFLPEKKGAMLE